MPLSRQAAFAPIGEIVARQVLPRSHHARRLPLRISCIGIARYDGLGDTDGFARTIVIGECPSPEDAMIFASQRVAASARDHRYRACLLEARLVDPFWRETAAELLRVPQAA